MLNATTAVDPYVFTFQSLLNQGFDRDKWGACRTYCLRTTIQSLLNQGFDRDGPVWVHSSERLHQVSIPS